MTPRLIISNCINGSTTNSKHFCNLIVGSAHFSDYQDLTFGEFLLSPIVCGPSFFDHIRRVFLGCSEPQMIGVAARRIVTTMANAKSIWDATVSKFPCHSMCFIFNFTKTLSGSTIQNAISVFVDVGLPFPAFVLAPLLNSLPKCYIQWINYKLLKSKIILFGKPVCGCFRNSNFSLRYINGFAFLRRNYQLVKNARPSRIVTAFEIMTHTSIIQRVVTFINKYSTGFCNISNWTVT